MSFILDALKKSEAERNRKSGPVLMDMRIAPARRHLPVWVWVIALVLLANLALLGYALLRSGTKGAPPVPVAAAPAPAAVVPAATLPPPVLPAARDAASNRDLPAAAPATGGVVMQSNAVVPPDNPAVPAQRAPAAAPAGATSTDLPSDDDLRASGVTLPELHLSLHVYDDNAANRFVLLNSSRLREGQETAEGVRVERIDPTGVVLSWRGRQFRVRPVG
jgi:general secretion pathway protein B